MRNIIFAFILALGLFACVAHQSPPPPETPEAVSARLQPLTDASQKMDVLASNDPAYAGSYVDTSANKVVVSFTKSASRILPSYSADRIYVARTVRFSMLELRRAEAEATRIMRDNAIKFHILALDIERNRILVEGLDKRQSAIVRKTLGSKREVLLIYK
jgi:hypothetical protein